MRMPSVVLVIASLALTGCPAKAPPGTPTGAKVLDWNRGPTTFSTGVSLGKDIGPVITDQRIVTFTPKDQRNSALGIVRLDVRIERGEVAIEPNSQGVRPAEKGTAPRHLGVTVTENKGWTISGKCDPPVNGPGAGSAPGAVTFNQNCTINLTSGDDTGTVILSVAGEGKHQFTGAFGTVTTVP